MTDDIPRHPPVRRKGVKSTAPLKGRRKTSPWHKKYKTTSGKEVVTGTAEHREHLKKRHAAGTPNVHHGRKTDYNEYHPVNARKLIALGCTEFEVCEFFGISLRTCQLWMKDHEEFRDAIKFLDEDGTMADDRVKRSLYHRAVGYSYHSEKIMVVDKEVERVPFVEHIPPDTGSMAFWLKNRLPKEFKDRRELDVVADIRVAAITSQTSPQDALALFRAVLDGATIDLDAVEDVES